MHRFMEKIYKNFIDFLGGQKQYFGQRYVPSVESKRTLYSNILCFRSVTNLEGQKPSKLIHNFSENPSQMSNTDGNK